MNAGFEIILHYMRLRPSCTNIARSKFQIPAMHFNDYVLHLSAHRVIVCETVVIPSFQVLGLLIFFFMDHLSLQNGNC